MSDSGDIDLYEVLGISQEASPAEVKKAYHKAALSSHPDKVPESEREEAEIRFKTVSQAYEILYDDEKRHLYDTLGMAAFDPSSGAGGGAEPDLDEIWARMSRAGMGGMGGMGGMPDFGGMGGPPKRPRKGKNEEQEYEVTLEELYKGKTTRFASTKNVICETCNGSGGKDKCKPHDCSVCGGKGQKQTVHMGGGLIIPSVTTCGNCDGFGKVYKDKEKCKKCKGKRVVEKRKILELYVPRGAREGEKIVLAGEADQSPDQEPGDIIFEIVEKDHPVFRRAGADLQAELRITLAEALTGFNRVVLNHLDGRGISLNIKQPRGKVLRPGQVLKVPGEGMPIKRTDDRGDLFLTVNIEFPEDGWIRDETVVQSIRNVLPGPKPEIKANDVEEVDVEFDADIEEFEANLDNPRDEGAWEDDDDEMPEGIQCQPQ